MDEIIKKRYEENPLMVFSLFMPRYVNIVKNLGKEILSELSDKPSKKDESKTVKREVWESTDKFWLFVLSSYEVLRTLCQNKNCFKENMAEKICCYKKIINEIRIPFAKLEVAGKKEIPVYYENCIYSISNYDFCYKIKTKIVSARELITGYLSLMDEIQLSDITESYDELARQKLGIKIKN